MNIVRQLYESAVRTSVGHAILYRVLRLRYRRSRRQNRRIDSNDIERLVAMLTSADFEAACRLATNSWSQCDLLNERLFRDLMIEVTSRRPDLGMTPQAVDCIVRVKSSSDTLGCVDSLLAENYSFGDINTALQIVHLGRIPDSDRRRIISMVHPEEMLAVIGSSRHYGRGRRIVST